MSEVKHTSGLLGELERLVRASEAWDFSISMNTGGLPPDEQEAARLMHRAMGNYRAALEYDLMKYRLTSEALGIAHWDMDVIDGDPVNPGNKFSWSQEFRRMIGFSDERDFPNILSSWSSRLHPDDYERVLNAFMAHLNDSTGKTPYDLEYRLMMKNGDYRHFRAFGSTMRDSMGVPLRVAGALEDITVKKLMQEKIAVESAKTGALAHWYKSILDATPFPISVTGADMNWTFVNKAVENFLGAKREDMLGKPCSGWNANICNTDACGIACARRGLKHTFFTHQGESYQVDVEILKDLEGGIAGFIEVVQDITQIEAMAKEKAEAQAANRAKSTFLARMSHEIRTPMNAIMGIAEMQMQNEALPQETREAFGRIYRSGDLLLNIINDILDLSKIEAGMLELAPIRYEVASLINDAVQLIIMQYESKPIKFELQIDEKTPLYLIGDELRIRQALSNLLSNAFKYTNKGRVSLSVFAEAQEKTDDITLVFRVSDTGQGMTPEQVEKLFDEYSRFNMGANRTTVGTGLGMSITKNLVRMMNGEISVQSEFGKGSVFTMRLPQKSAGSGITGVELAECLSKLRFTSTTQINKARIIRDHMPYGKVLVVDDLESNIYVAKLLLQPYGLQIDTALSGFEAVEKIKDGCTYDIVFMDHMMPEMDGLEAVKLIRGMGYEHPVVALTANAVAGQAEVFLANGFDAFISKPVDVRQLNAALNQLIRDRHPREVVDAARREKNRAVAGAMPHHHHDASHHDSKSQLLKFFVRDSAKAVKALDGICEKRGSLTDEDINTYTVHVHSMKTALRLIGENALSDTALMLEKAGRKQNISVIAGETPAFLEKLHAVIERAASTEKGVKGSISEDIQFLCEKMFDLQTACAVHDRNAAASVLAELEQKTFPEQIKKQLDGISQHLKRDEHDDAVEIAEKTIRMIM